MNTITIRHIYPNEYDTVVALISASFGRDRADAQALAYHWHTHLPHKPTTKLEDYRAIVRETENGHEVIAFIRLEQRQLYYGRTLLRVALISDVCTHPDYRHQGYSSALMRDTLAYLAEQGGHIAMLYDPATYYQQYGFSPLFPQYQLHIKRHAIRAWANSQPSDDALNATIRHATRDDLPHIAHLYEKHWRSRLTLHRDANLWKWFWMAQESTLQVVAEDDRITGYIWHHPRLHRTEVVADSAAATHALLVFDNHANSSQAYHLTHANDDVLIWDVPPDDLITAYVRLWLPLELRVLSQPDSGRLGRLMDTNALLNAVVPELRTELRASKPDADVESLILSAEPDAIVVEWRNNAMSAIRIPHRDFLPMLFGSLRPTTLALRQQISPQQADLLEQIFPQRIASIGAWDM